MSGLNKLVAQTTDEQVSYLVNSKQGENGECTFSIRKWGVLFSEDIIFPLKRNSKTYD